MPTLMNEQRCKVWITVFVVVLKLHVYISLEGFVVCVCVLHALALVSDNLIKQYVGAKMLTNHTQNL